MTEHDYRRLLVRRSMERFLHRRIRFSKRRSVRLANFAMKILAKLKYLCYVRLHTLMQSSSRIKNRRDSGDQPAGCRTEQFDVPKSATCGDVGS